MSRLPAAIRELAQQIRDVTGDVAPGGSIAIVLDPEHYRLVCDDVANHSGDQYFGQTGKASYAGVMLVKRT